MNKVFLFLFVILFVNVNFAQDLPHKMTEKEKLESYIAMCKCCLLAQAMKSCPLCRFNIGLAEEAMLGDAIPVLINAQTPMFIAVE